jgi:hypothetical protein
MATALGPRDHAVGEPVTIHWRIEDTIVIP